MSQNETSSNQPNNLRRKAEEKAAKMTENLEALSPVETRQILHELRVHQIELEMQNEELRRYQMEFGSARERYFDLFDLAPVGYYTISKEGLIYPGGQPHRVFPAGRGPGRTGQAADHPVHLQRRPGHLLPTPEISL